VPEERVSNANATRKERHVGLSLHDRAADTRKGAGAESPSRGVCG
jgi:hypothetical protein